MLRGGLFFILAQVNFFSHAVNIEMWHQSAESVNFWLEAVEAFQLENPSIKVKVSKIPPDELKLAILRTVYQGHAPDVVLAPSDFIGKYKQMKLSPVSDDYLNINQQSKFLHTTQINGINYGIPLIGGNHLSLYYNKKLVKQAASTWQQLIAQQSEFTSKGLNTVALRYNDIYWFASFITAYGGFPVKGEQITLDNQAVIDALVFYKGLSQQRLVPSHCDYDCVTKDFFEQKFAYSINGGWAYKQTAKSLGNNFAVATLPNIGDKVVHPLFSSLALIFPNQALEGNKSVALKKFTDFLQKKTIQKRLYDVTGLMPTHTQVMQVITEQADDNRQALLRQLALAKTMPPSQAMSAAWIGMAQGLKLFLNDKVGAQQAAKLMQKIAQRELDKMRLEP